MKAKLQAHRGVSTLYPENTVVAFKAAAELGYPYIELDPAVTADGQVVVLHDKTVNRTGRLNGQKLEKDTFIRDLTLAEARKLDFGVWKNAFFKGEPIPLLADVLNLAADMDMTVKIDNKFLWSFNDGEREALMKVLKVTRAKLGITVNRPELVAEYAQMFPRDEIHYDGLVTEEILQQISAVVPANRLVVWIAYPNQGTSWVKVPRADENLCALVRKYARLGVWILTTEEEQKQAEAWGAEIIETTGSLKP